MHSTQSLPFDLDADAVRGWLIKLSHLEPIQASEQLYKALKLLNKSTVDAKLLLPILDKLTPTALHLSTSLESLFAAEKIILTAKIRKLAKLSIQLLRQLCMRHAQLAIDPSFDKQQQTLLIGRAMQIIGISLRQSALIYQRPDASLWQTQGELFQFAKKNGLLQIETKEKHRILKLPNNISAIVIRNLLFTVCNPYRFSVTEIRLLFTFAGQHYDLMQIGLQDNYAAKAGIYWNYLSDIPPQALQPGLSLKSKLLLNSNKLFELLDNKEFVSPFCKETILQLLCSVSGYQNILQLYIASPPEIFQVIIGFLNISDFLEKPDHYLKTNNLDILPFEQQKQAKQTSRGKIWQNDNLNVTVHTAKLQPIKNTNYIIADLDRLQHNVGEPALIFSHSQTPMLGIVRRIQPNSQVTEWRLLLEMLVSKIIPVKIADISKQKKMGILLHQVSQKMEILLPIDKYESGSTIKIEQPNQPQREYTLLNLLDFTPYYMRYHIAETIETSSGENEGLIKKTYSV